MVIKFSEMVALIEEIYSPFGPWGEKLYFFKQPFLKIFIWDIKSGKVFWNPMYITISRNEVHKTDNRHLMPLCCELQSVTWYD